jgi:histidyl-tRNA synthetase
MTFQALRGTADLLELPLQRWRRIEQALRLTATLHGYQEIRTPVIEDAGLFLRSVGETSDIVQKEMFSFQDRGGHAIVLRPEGTAPVVRAFVNHHLDKTLGLAKLFYIGAMFRAERPQAGRFRQFHQFGAEAIGSDSPWIDVEVIDLCVQALNACGVSRPAVCIASMGSRQDQQRSASELRKRLDPERLALCKECQTRFEKNIFRVLDCKSPSCRAIVWQGPQSPFLLSDESHKRYDTVRTGLKAAGIAFDDTQVFARGLDYYTHTVFEVRSAVLGAQDAVAAGGRYDRLVEELGGPAVGAIGFAAGMERMLMAGSAVQAPSTQARAGAAIAVAQPELIAQAYSLVGQLRRRGIAATMDLDGKSLKSQLREADKAGRRFVAILGPEEIKSGMVTVKDLQRGQQSQVGLADFVQTLASWLGAGE